VKESVKDHNIFQNKFWKKFLAGEVFPPLKIEDNSEFKSFSTSYMIWMFSQEKFLELYEEFISNNLIKIHEKLVDALKIENFLDKQMLKDYLDSMTKIYTQINFGSNQSNNQSQINKINQVSHISHISQVNQRKDLKTEDNDESKEISSDIALNITQNVSVDLQLHKSKGNISSKTIEEFYFEIPMKYNEILIKRHSETTSTEDSVTSRKNCPF